MSSDRIERVGDLIAVLAGYPSDTHMYIVSRSGDAAIDVWDYEQGQWVSIWKEEIRDE